MDYVGHIIRPPSEASSMLIQTTVGCSHNMCTFCGTYKDVSFRVKDMETIMADIHEASAMGHSFKRAFLPDGDALIMETDDLLKVFSEIRRLNPTIEKIGVYGNVRAILRKSESELKELHDAGLGIVFQGIESGNETVLRNIRKGALPKHMITAAHQIISAGITLSQTVLLGIGGREGSENHAIDTGKLLSEMSPDFASALTVMLLPNTPLHTDWQKGDFMLPEKFQLIQELRLILEHFNPSRECYFTSNHASNYLPLKAYLPDQKDEVCAHLDAVLRKKDESGLKPESLRAL
jgi:radical SAM superfamily enzyme YgiQ (UPF0313 family)